jgi:hypothetical protein
MEHKTNSMAAAVVRGVTRLLSDGGYRVVTELVLTSGRRVDVAGLDRRGGIALVEVKSSLADLRGDGKWPEYLPFADVFYFAVPPGFPLDALPDGTGVIVADGYAGTVVRAAPLRPVNAARRRALMLRFARTAAGRLDRLLDARL